MIEDMRERVDKIEDQVDKIAARMNMAIGGIVALGSVALVNLAVNVVQAATGGS